jgi:hypothetical protein
MINVNVTIRAMGVGRVHLLEMMVSEIIQGGGLKVTWPVRDAIRRKRYL